MRKRARRVRPDWRRLLRNLAIAFGVAVVAFAAAYIVTVRILFPPLPEPENGIVVPRLTGLTVSTAEARLRQAGLRITEVNEVAHPTQPAGLIIAQSPLPGQQLRELGSVRLAISSGLPRAGVPNVVGLTAERARTVLGSVGFGVDEQVEQNDAAAGIVFRVSPPAGSEQPVPSQVVMFVSSGPPPPPVDTAAAPLDTVPDRD